LLGRNIVHAIALIGPRWNLPLAPCGGSKKISEEWVGLNKKFIEGGRKMYKKILVPLDGSELSECVLDHVTAIATGCRIPEVILLTVIEPVSQQVYAELGEQLARDIQNKAPVDVNNYLLKVADSLKKDGLVVQTAVISGKATEKILDYANKNQVDLIVMSTHGRSGISRWAFGSVADRVLRHSRVPVLTVSPAGCRSG